MIYTETQKTRELAPHLRRVLLMDASVASTRMTAEVLKDLGAARIYTETSDERALLLCKQMEPQVIITELSGPTLDGLRFVRNLRRSSLSSRSKPVIVIASGATASSIINARNAGVHEFLRKPFTIRDLTRRLEAVMLHGRDWIEAVNYVGPDRRRFNAGDYVGPRKRLADSIEQGVAGKIEQALRILASAIKAIETDPVQSLRSMQAQAETLNAVAVAGGDIDLITDVAALQRCLISAASSGSLSRASVEGAAAGLWRFMPGQQDISALPAFELA